jgi:hypothetical protein
MRKFASGQEWEGKDARVALGTGTALRVCQLTLRDFTQADDDCGSSNDIPRKQDRTSTNRDVESERKQTRQCSELQRPQERHSVLAEAAFLRHWQTLNKSGPCQTDRPPPGNHLNTKSRSFINLRRDEFARHASLFSLCSEKSSLDLPQDIRREKYGSPPQPRRLQQGYCCPSIIWHNRVFASVHQILNITVANKLILRTI